MPVAQVRASRERNLITCSEHWHSSRTFLQLGIENPKGSYHQLLGSIVFTAFTLEAFLNHVGEALFKSWADLEKLTRRGKINVIAEKLGLEVDFGTMPWQVVPEIFGVRNKIAHGKNELLQDERMGEILWASWQNYATRENAERARDKVEEICKTISAKTEFDEHTLIQNRNAIRQSSVHKGRRIVFSSNAFEPRPAASCNRGKPLGGYSVLHNPRTPGLYRAFAGRPAGLATGQQFCCNADLFDS